MPRGKIKSVSISRLLIGGNLIGGWAHARDLIYMSKLFKAYNTESKIFETLELCEQCGINTIQVDPRDWEDVLAGMFDFQVEQDAKLAIEAVRKTTARQRPGRA